MASADELNPTNRRRLPALDGLRGLAALVVVLHHCLLVAPVFAAAYGPPRSTAPSGWSWWLVSTPLHLVWAGGEAVFVFFILSGFVLSLPAIDGSGTSWGAYYARRLVRLYVPVWGSVIVSLLCYAVVSHRAAASLSWWTNMHDLPVTSAGIGRDAGLLDSPGVYDSALWSLHWEVLFSLLLPVYVFVARRLGRLRLPAAVALLAVIEVGHLRAQPYLVYLPMFAIGVLMAADRHRLALITARLRRGAWTVVTALAIALLTADWTVPALAGDEVLPVAGATLILILFLGQPHARALGESRYASWLGKRSFSLYLVHEPIVVSVAFALHTDRPELVLLVALPLALLGATAFHAAVEQPSHRLATTVGRRYASRTVAEPAGQPEPAMAR